ncbi:MAG: SIMPL domain-containing protein [Acidobacteria bacterium]|nr:SIMPL domain-containing protein [Acidobacteriota bacterium]MBK8149817.1 SIMPL domain-containing protein [Acidobacteriota bacterium]MBK8809241.1 SIMPL domain-containing protein [Acidobacteriota bacterium]
MRKGFWIFVILFFVNSFSFGQERSNASTYGNTERRRSLATGELAGSEATKDVTEVFFLEATVLMNVKADEFVASFGVQGEGQTSALSEQSVDTRIDALRSKLGTIGITDMFVDFINQAPYYEFDASGKVATEKLKGYKTAKNLMIRFKDRGLLRQITNLANAAGIYDLIKIDFVVNDFAGIKQRMLTEATKIIKAKEQTYAGLGITLKPVGVVNEKFNSYSPDELYQDYTAYEAGNTQGYRRVIQKAKASTSYYDGFDGRDFDLTINPAGLEPNVQAVMYLKVKYLPTILPENRCCAETKTK